VALERRAHLRYSEGAQPNRAHATISAITRSLYAIAVYQLDPDALEKAGLEVVGDTAAVRQLAALLDPGGRNFNIVTP